ncbi:MAG: S41 family peptidase [Rickettsiales bacterium]|nr:S41 family peptidase [Rickettsiales bacterium]
MKKAIRYFIYVLFVCVLGISAYMVLQNSNYTIKFVNKNEIDEKHYVNTINKEQQVIQDGKVEEKNANNSVVVGSNTINNLKFMVGGVGKDVDNKDLFDYVIERIKASYVEEVKDKEIYESALKGILSSLDPHSMYLNEKEFKEMQVQTKGEFGGLGIVVTKDSNFIKVVSPIDDTPAARAGILSGDYISEIDGTDTFDMSLTDAVDKMRGKVGEKVKIVVLRKGENKPLEFSLKREIIKIDAVKGSIKNNNIIYLRITNFIETTQQDTINMFNTLKNKITDSKVAGVILDLRNNPGGLLDQSIKVSELFLDGNKTVVSIKGRDNQYFEDYKTNNKKALIKNVPIVVLVNEGSASASEIVAGALQDYKVAIVMGEKTFGKASVQQVFPLMNGGAVKMTIARYYTPLGRSIQLDGIVPDIIVKKGEVVFSNKLYPEIREKDLKGHLEKHNNSEDILTKTVKEKKEEMKSQDVIDDSDLKDYQLLKAIDLINGVNFYNKK